MTDKTSVPRVSAPPLQRPKTKPAAKPFIGEHVEGLPAGPWSYLTTAPLGEHEGNGHVYIVDASGRKIASLWGPPGTKMATAELILRARESANV